MARQVFNPPSVYSPHQVFGDPAYEQAIRVKDTIYLSGQAPLDLNGQIVGRGDPTAQAEQVMQNLKAVLEAAGARLADVVKLTIYYTRPEDR